MTPVSARPPAAGEDEEFRQILARTNPDLYRNLALYLQVLREGLPNSVAQVCFHLATQAQPGRYASLEPARRRALHRGLQTLVRRTCSLLTVEQLSHLALRMEQERLSRRLEARRHLLERLSRSSTDLLEGAELLDSEGEGEAESLPDGSVRLELGLPLGGGWLDWGDGGVPEIQTAGPGSGGLAHGRDVAASEAEDEGDVQGDTPGDSEDRGDALPPLTAIGGFFEDFATALGLPLQEERSGPQAPPPPAGPEDRPGRGSEAGPSDPLAAFRPPPEGGLLPRDPLLLMAWLEAFEQALARRLRNLSNAINGELLRCGLLRALLPVSLLDAVLAGQFDSQSAQPNLLRVQLPLSIGAAVGAQGRIEAVLLRCGDLEREQPRLRTVRRQLQQRRQESRRMAEQYHRLQRRLQAREAEALWLQDIRTTGQAPQGDPPGPR